MRVKDSATWSSIVDQMFGVRLEERVHMVDHMFVFAVFQTDDASDMVFSPEVTCSTG